MFRTMVVSFVCVGMVAAQEPRTGAPTAKSDGAVKLSAAGSAKLGAAADKAIGYYRKIQADSGSLAPGDRFEMGITGLAVAGMLKTKRIAATDPLIAKAMGFLETHVQPSGGIHPKALDGQANYLTSIALIAFQAANEGGKYQKTIDDAVKFLKGGQWSEAAAGGAKVGPEDARYGGFGYSAKSRPDLSNTSFTIEALASAGVPKDDPAMQRAITFLRRCQNFTGEGGNDKFTGDKAAADGGFGYNPLESTKGNDPKKGKSPAGGLRSYGSMTYAGFKSFLYAGLSKDDPRVKAALDWIKAHYTLDENPGMGQQGLFYYFQTFSKALAVAGIEKLEVDAGTAHDWREQLVNKLAAKQREDGSWANANKQWLEDNPSLATGFALLSLAQAMQ